MTKDRATPFWLFRSLIPTGPTVQFSTERYGLCIMFMVPYAVGDDRQHTAHMMKHVVIMEHETSMHSTMPHPEFEGGRFYSPWGTTHHCHCHSHYSRYVIIQHQFFSFLAMNTLFLLYEPQMARCSVICFGVS